MDQLHVHPAGVDRQLEVFTRLPEEFRRHGAANSWAKANRGGIGGEAFLEGPVFDPDGNLFVTDIEHGRIFRIDLDARWSLVAEFDGEPNGMKFLSTGELLVTDYKNGLVVVEIDTGAVRPFLGRRNAERFKGVNDLVFDRSGSLYFTDQGQTGLHDPTGRVFRRSPDGRLEMLLGNVPSPNGLVLSPDEKVLYLAVTRDNAVWRVPLMDDGSVSKVGRFFTANGPGGPDGLAMDVEGRLLVANPGIGIVWVLDQLARPVDVLHSPAGLVTTNVAFGGPERRTVYCTESETNSILRATLNVAGCELHVPQM